MTVQGQSLVKFAANMQDDVFAQASVIDIKVVVIPLKAGAGSPFFVVPVVVDSEGTYILVFPENQKIC